MNILAEYKEYLNSEYNSDSAAGYLSDAVSLFDFLSFKNYSKSSQKLNESEWGRAGASLNMTEYYLYLNEQQKIYSAATINRRISSHKHLIGFLKKKNVIDEDFSKQIKSLHKEESKKEYLSEQECLALISSCSGTDQKRDRAIIGLLLFSGLRANEVRMLKKSDIGTNTLTCSTGTENPRTAEINDALRAILSDFINDERITPHDNLFCGQANKPLSRRTLQQIVEKHLKQCGLYFKGAGSEYLRRSGAEMLIRHCSADIYEIKQYLGHKNLSATEKYFSGESRLGSEKLNRNPAAKGIMKIL